MNDKVFFKETLQLTLDGALAVAHAARAKARELNINVTIAIVDTGGHLILLHRDGSGCHTVEVAQAKARTAASMGRHSAMLSGAVNNSEHANDLSRYGGLTVLPGGIPLIVSGQRVGGIGTSGASGEQDIAVSEAGAAALVL